MGHLEPGTRVTERHSEGKTTLNAAQHARPEVAIPAPQAPLSGARRPGNGWPPWGIRRAGWWSATAGVRSSGRVIRASRGGRLPQLERGGGFFILSANDVVNHAYSSRRLTLHCRFPIPVYQCVSARNAGPTSGTRRIPRPSVEGTPAWPYGLVRARQAPSRLNEVLRFVAKAPIPSKPRTIPAGPAEAG